jgi:hypothetical protein
MTKFNTRVMQSQLARFPSWALVSDDLIVINRKVLGGLEIPGRSLCVEWMEPSAGI